MATRKLSLKFGARGKRKPTSIAGNAHLLGKLAPLDHIARAKYRQAWEHIHDAPFGEDPEAHRAQRKARQQACRRKKRRAWQRRNAKRIRARQALAQSRARSRPGRSAPLRRHSDRAGDCRDDDDAGPPPQRPPIQRRAPQDEATEIGAQAAGETKAAKEE